MEYFIFILKHQFFNQICTIHSQIWKNININNSLKNEIGFIHFIIHSNTFSSKVVLVMKIISFHSHHCRHFFNGACILKLMHPMFCFDHQKHIKQTKWLQTMFFSFSFFPTINFCHFSNPQNATLCFSSVNSTNFTFFCWKISPNFRYEKKNPSLQCKLNPFSKKK